MEMIISLIAGAIGGNASAAALKSQNQGLLINSMAGLVGGGVGGTVLALCGIPDMVGAGRLDLGHVMRHVIAGGLGGGVVLALLGLVRKILVK